MKYFTLQYWISRYAIRELQHAKEYLREQRIAELRVSDLWNSNDSRAIDIINRLQWKIHYENL